MPMLSVWLLSTVLLAACQTTNDRGTVSYAVPSNYRQLVARKVTEDTARLGPIRNATISQPVERFLGVMGVSRPIVCVMTSNDGPFIPHVTRWFFLFENGQIVSTVQNPGAIYCMSAPEEPFPEAVKRT
jgi:hypothetical protein